MSGRKGVNFNLGEGSIQRVIALGTGSVSIQTAIVGLVPQGMQVESVRFHGQAAVTGTSITAEVFARTKAGASGNTLQSAATDIKFTTAAVAKAGVAAALTRANGSLLDGQLLEVVVTASSISAGPGDLLVEIAFTPKYIRG